MTIYIQQMSSLYVYVVFFIASYSVRIEASRCMHRVFRMMMAGVSYEYVGLIIVHIRPKNQ